MSHAGIRREQCENIYILKEFLANAYTRYVWVERPRNIVLAVGMPEMLVLTAVAVWLAAGIWLAVTDYRTGILPTRLIWPVAGAVWLLFAAPSVVDADPSGLVGAALGSAACGALLAAVHFVHPPSMGFGDVRLSVLNGLLCGWWGWQIALLGLAAGFVLALPEALVVLSRHGMRASRPLGPYLVAGAGATVAWAAATRGLVPAR